MTAKKVPMRSCAACREKMPKNELVRIVRSPEGEISVDLTGTKSGRGVYICNKTACLNKAKKSGAISRALEIAIPDEVYLRLEEEIAKDE